MLIESSGWPILSLLFSCSWQWVEPMADLTLWLLCRCCLANGMQQQANSAVHCGHLLQSSC